ncbi:MAG: MFS transporter, partial [Dehalococcoidia bacterium]|nr:MFS transporter [Dehalococcoidia bacterium]
TFDTVELIGAPIAGVLGDRLGHRLFLLAGPIIGAVAAQLLGLTTLLPVLFVVMALKGLSVATSVPATLAFLSYATRESDRLRVRALAWFEVGSMAGLGLGGFVGGLVNQTLGMWAFSAVAGLYLAAFAALFAVVRTPIPVVVASEPVLDLGRLARQPTLFRFVPAWLAVQAFVGLWVTHAPFLLAQPPSSTQLLQGGFTGATVGALYLAVGVIVACGTLFWGSVLVGRPRTFGMYAGVGGLAALTVLLWALNRSGTTWEAPQFVLLALSGMAGLVASGFTPAALAQLADIAEEQGEYRGAVMGLYSVLFGVGQVVGSAAGGPLERAMGADGLILLTGVLTLAAFLGIRLVATGRRPPQPTPAPTAE